MKRLLLQILLLPVFPCLAKGPDPESFNKPTDIERAQTETSARMFDLYLEGKPVTDAYLADVQRDPSITANKVQGEAAADLAQKAQPTYDPNRGVSIPAVTGMAQTRSKVMGDIGQDAVAQKAAGMKSAVENAMGIQSSANTALSGMAQDAVSRNVNKAEGDYNSSAATASSLSSLAGAGTGMAMAYKKGASNG